MKKLKDLSFARILLLSVAVVLICHFVIGGINMAKDSSNRKNGSLKQITLAAEDFEIESMGKRGDRYVATDSDPQLLYVVDGLLTKVDFYMESSMPTGEVVVYYTTDRAAGFSEKQRTWAKPIGDGSYTIDFDGGYIHTLRIDPTIYGGNFILFGDFVINGEKSAAEYIGLNYRDIAFMALYSLILAVICRFVKELFTKNSQ